MRILYLTNIPSPYRVDFFNELGKYCELTVLFERERAGDRDSRWRADDFKNFKYIFLNGKKVGSDASFCPEVIRYLKTGYDAIILGGYSSPTYMLAMDYMRMRRIPFILNADGGFVKKDSKLLFLLKKHYIGGASAWLSTGMGTDRYLLYYGAKREFIHHYPFTSVREADRYCPTQEEKMKYKEELSMCERKVILTVGQFIPRKGFDLLLQAAGELPETTGIYVVGGKPEEAYLRHQETLRASVHYIDFMEKDKLRKYYLAADIFVFPTREDIWGLVLNEAMSFGLPCVASTKANASLELVEDGKNGYLVDPEDVDTMARKLGLLLKDDQLRAHMGVQAFKKMKDFTIEEMVKSHLSIIKGGA